MAPSNQRSQPCSKASARVLTFLGRASVRELCGILDLHSYWQFSRVKSANIRRGMGGVGLAILVAVIVFLTFQRCPPQSLSWGPRAAHRGVSDMSCSCFATGLASHPHEVSLGGSAPTSADSRPSISAKNHRKSCNPVVAEESFAEILDLTTPRGVPGELSSCLTRTGLQGF